MFVLHGALDAGIKRCVMRLRTFGDELSFTNEPVPKVHTLSLTKQPLALWSAFRR